MAMQAMNELHETMSTQIAKAVTGLEPESALAIRRSFDAMITQAEEWAARAREIRVTSSEQKREMKLARESRLALREIRNRIENTRKALKKDSLDRGRAIDGIANIAKSLIEPIEEHLRIQETFAEREETQRKDELRKSRSETLRAYEADPATFADLGEMSEDGWTSTLQTVKDAREARLEAERQAEAVRKEAERIAAKKRDEERAEQARKDAERAEQLRLQAEENARLKREADEREAKAKADREALEEAARVEREKSAEAKRAADEETRKAREEADRLAKELEDQRRAEDRRLQEEREAKELEERKAREAAEAAAAAPDREKIAAFAKSLAELELPAMTTERGKVAALKIKAQMAKMVDWVSKTGAAL